MQQLKGPQAQDVAIDPGHPLDGPILGATLDQSIQGLQIFPYSPDHILDEGANP